MRQHLFRINGTWYFRYVLPEKLIKALAVHQYRELRLSLYTTSHVYARELAKAYWLACRALVHSDLQALGIVTVDDFKSHLRRSVMSHLPQKFTPLIELTTSVDAGTLVPAIKILRDTFNAPFFVLPPPTIKGTLYKKVNGDWQPIINSIGQQLPYMRLPHSLIQNVGTDKKDWISPDHLLNNAKGEEQMFKLAEQWHIWLHQLFIPTDLPQAQFAFMVVRKLSDKPYVVMGSQPAPAPKAETPKSPRLSEVIENYCEHKKKKWRPKTMKEFRTHLRTFVDIVTDKEILQVTDEDGLYFINNLPRVPQNVTKVEPYRDMKLRDVLAMPDQPEVLSPKSVEQYFGTVRGFIKYAKVLHKGMSTILLELAPETNERGGAKRPPFKQQHLTTIFESDISLNYLRQCEHNYQVWMAPIALYTSARINEICALRLQDIGVEGGIHFIQFGDLTLEDITRLGKSDAAPRRIPMHSQLVSLGLPAFADAMRKSERHIAEGRLFPECTYVEDHGYRKRASEWFGEYLDKIGLGVDPLLVFHTWRHTALTKFNTTPNHPPGWMLDVYCGHKIKKTESMSVQKYLNDRQLSYLLPVLDVLQWDIDWARYKPLLERTYK